MATAMVTAMGDSCAVPLATCVRRLFLAATIPCCGLAYAETWLVTPELSVLETYSNNMTLTSVSPLQGWISDIAPSLHIAGSGARVKANLDYRLDSVYYSGNSNLQRNLNSLTSAATVEAIDKWLFLDASANIVQRKLSAFDTTATTSTDAARNRSETRTVQFSPHVQGQVSDLATYQMRFNSIDSDSNDASLANTQVNQWTGSLKNASAGAKIGWSMDGSTSHVQNAVIGSRDNARLYGGLIFEILSQLHVSLSDGTERTNYTTATMQSTATPGLGIEWSPSPRTQAAAQGEKRFFGTAHTMLFNHRTALTNWRYTDTKDVTVLPTSLTGSNQGTIADLMSNLLTASIPDPVARAAAIKARLDQNGAILNQPSTSGVQTSRLTVSRAQEASVALIGSRNTVTLSLTQLNQQAIGSATGTADSFSLSNDILQRGGSISWIHLLTPFTTLNLGTAHVKSIGLSATNLNSSQLSHTASISYRMGPKTFVSVGARNVKFDSTLNGHFKENAAVLALTQRF
jgi:uncharacterized protein (PEP-CTERM system associated)